MQTSLAHLQVNVDAANLGFYRSLMQFLGWSTLYDDESMVGVGAPNETSLWFTASSNGTQNDYDGPGVNHIGIAAPSQADVDATARYLADHRVPALFDTPRHRPEFSAGEGQTFYQVMFESPDRVLFEVVYTGALSG